MSFIEILLIGVALSMDAFAVSVCKGLSMKEVRYSHAAVIALYFGGFQALMPLLGWLGGSYAKSYIEKYDHWIAFALLLLIGLNMVRDALKGEEEEIDPDFKLDHKELLLMAIATSIDALAVGIALAMDDVNIGFAASIIGITTFSLSFIGVAIGNRIGARFQSKAQLAGGIVLILIGIKILFEHMGWLG
ncbi:MAG: manganese efflux pump [Firmicutes bacterium]|nr:manganese efflux pump [Bacillota bacterium]